MRVGKQWLHGRRMPWCRALRGLGLIGGLIAVGGLTSCGTIEPVAPTTVPVTDPTQLYMSLTFDHRAVTLDTASSYNTVQLTAVPRAAAGNVLEGLPAPTYRSTDTSRVTVTDNGLVTAVAATNGTNVVASLTAGPVTFVDTARIQVTTLASPPQLASLSIHPLPQDSAVWAWQPQPTELDGYIVGGGGAGIVPDFIQIAARSSDVVGNPIPTLTVAYTSLDSAVAVVDRNTGVVRLLQPGQVRLVAEAMAYGTVKVDTMTYTVTHPVIQDIGIQVGATGALDFTSAGLGDGQVAPSMRDIRIAPFGMIIWYWADGGLANDIADVVFDDPTHVAAAPDIVCSSTFVFSVYSPTGCGSAGNVFIPRTGHIPGSFFSTVQIRQFPVPGIYPWHSTKLGISGQVIVTADLDE